MKCIILLFVSVLFSQALGDNPSSEAAELGIKLEKSFKSCGEKNNIKPEQIANIQQFKLPIDKNVQCAFACIAKELNIMVNDSTFDKTKIASILKLISDDLKIPNKEEISKKIQEVVDICLPLQKGNSDECAAANKAVECFIENGKKNGLIPN